MLFSTINILKLWTFSLKKKIVKFQALFSFVFVEYSLLEPSEAKSLVLQKDNWKKIQLTFTK